MKYLAWLMIGLASTVFATSVPVTVVETKSTSNYTIDLKDLAPFKEALKIPADAKSYTGSGTMNVGYESATEGLVRLEIEVNFRLDVPTISVVKRTAPIPEKGGM